MAKKFLYISLGILALAGAWHLGAAGAVAQGSTQFAGISSFWGTSGGKTLVAITAGGDIYARSGYPNIYTCDGSWTNETACPDGWFYAGNVLGGPVSTDPSSLGAIKGSYR